MNKLIIIVASLALFVSSCKKCDPPVTPVDMSNTTWKGLSTVAGLNLTDREFNLIFNADGTLSGSLVNGSSFAIKGTWNKTPSSNLVRLFFTLASVTGEYVGQATLSTDNSKLEGGIGTNATTPATNLTFNVSKL